VAGTQTVIADVQEKKNVRIFSRQSTIASNLKVFAG